MFEVVYNFTANQRGNRVQCGVFDTFEEARDYVLEQFDRLVEDTTDWETGKGMVEDENWYENFILEKYLIRQTEVTVN